MWSPPESRCPNDDDDDDGTEPTRNTADDGDDGDADDGSRWSPRCYCCWQRCRCSMMMMMVVVTVVMVIVNGRAQRRSRRGGRLGIGQVATGGQNVVNRVRTGPL